VVVYVILSIFVYEGMKRTWLEIAMKLPRLQYLILLTTCLYQPPLREGQFYYGLDTIHGIEMEDAIIEFAQAAVEKLTTGVAAPFQIRVNSPAEGP